MPAAAQPAPEPSRVLAEIRPPTGPALAGLDLWELDADRALALLHPDEATALQAAGYSLTERRRFAAGRPALAAQFGPGGYKGTEAVLAELRAIAQAYPAVASERDVGVTREGRPIRALRLTAGTGGKPAVVYLAAYHAREVVTPELALRAARYFAEGYGRDPLATHLLATRELWVVPLVNADGYARVEAGAEFWRKNVLPGDCGPEPGRPANQRHPGVDLNRNHAYAWDPPRTASADDACAETYRGPEPTSEPETRAVEQLLAGVPATTLISWHAYGNVVLWPPSSQVDPVAVHPVVGALGRRLAAATGYAGGTGGAALYPTSGELTEWAWYARGVAGFTIEVGRYEDGTDGNPFTPPYRNVERYWAENKAAALYLARVADDPARATAPDPTSVTATLPFGGASATVESALSPGTAGPAAAAELFVGTPGAEGTGQPGQLSAEGTRATWRVATAGLPPGRHALWARARAATGPWGPLSATTVLVGRQSLLFPALARAGRLD